MALTIYAAGWRLLLQDNDFIYHASIVTQPSLFPEIGKAEIAKPILPSANQPMSDQSFADLFSEILSIPVYQAMATFHSKEQSIIHKYLSKLQDATQDMNAMLASMNLPASLEDTKGTGIPQSLLEKVNLVQMQGGLEELERSINESKELRQRASQLLDQALSTLDEEESLDRSKREEFGGQWRRCKSSELTGCFRSEINKYRSLLQNAAQSDAKVESTLQNSKGDLGQLCEPKDSLVAKIPTGEIVGEDVSDIISLLKDLLLQSDVIKSERGVLENVIKNVHADDVADIFLRASKSEPVNEEKWSKEKLDSMFDGIEIQVVENLEKQKSLMEQITGKNEEFESFAAPSRNERKRKLTLLASAYETFVEVNNNLEDGQKFYRDIEKILKKIIEKIDDVCFARNTEANVLSHELIEENEKSKRAAAAATSAFSSSIMPTAPLGPGLAVPPFTGLPFIQDPLSNPLSSMPPTFLTPTGGGVFSSMPPSFYNPAAANPMNPFQSTSPPSAAAAGASSSAGAPTGTSRSFLPNFAPIGLGPAGTGSSGGNSATTTAAAALNWPSATAGGGSWPQQPSLGPAPAPSAAPEFNPFAFQLPPEYLNYRQQQLQQQHSSGGSRSGSGGGGGVPRGEAGGGG